MEVTPAASPTPAPAIEQPPPPPTYSHDPEELKPTPPPPPVQPLGRVVADDPPPPVVEPVPVPEKSIYERAIAAAAASPRRKAPERGRQRTRSTPSRAPSPRLKHKVDPAAQRLYDRAAEVRRKLEEKRKQRPPKCTFQPKIDAVSKKVAAAAASMAPRHERLHGDAERRRAALRARIETQQRRERAGAHAAHVDKGQADEMVREKTLRRVTRARCCN